MARKKFITTKELFNGFSDSQIQELMKNITIFMPMDGCPSPCGICALQAKKTVNYVMDFSLIKHLYSNFSEDFNNNHPNEHANDQLAYRGENKEDFSDVLELQRDFLNYYPRVWTGFPSRAGSVLKKILEMRFVSENHPGETLDSQLVIPAISRNLTNRKLVDRYTAELEGSDRFVEKRNNQEPGKIDSTSYFLRTRRGIRELKVREIIAVAVGSAKKYQDNPEISKGGAYQIQSYPGVAVLPTGFYEYRGGLDCGYKGILKRKITPEHFDVPKIRNLLTYLYRDSKTGEVLHLPMSRGAYK